MCLPSLRSRLLEKQPSLWQFSAGTPRFLAGAGDTFKMHFIYQGCLPSVVRRHPRSKKSMQRDLKSLSDDDSVSRTCRQFERLLGVQRSDNSKPLVTSAAKSAVFTAMGMSSEQFQRNAHISDICRPVLLTVLLNPCSNMHTIIMSTVEACHSGNACVGKQ